MFETATPYADGDFSNVEEVTLAGFIIEPYNDGQFITKAMIYRAFDVPGQEMDMTAPTFGTIQQDLIIMEIWMVQYFLF